MKDNIKEKTLLILGAGRGQVGLYKAAKNLGIRTIAGTLPTDNHQCLDLADEICIMNIADPDDVMMKADTIDFDGVTSCCIDLCLPSLGRLCDKHFLAGYSEKTALMCNDKLSMKRCLRQNNVNTAEFAEVANIEQLDSAIESIGGYPVIIKATDLAGSMGINKAFNREEASMGLFQSMAATKKDFVIVEKLLQGREFGAQAFVSNGEILFVMPHGDILFHGATDVPVGHYVPFDADENLLQKINIETAKAIKALGLNNCAVNIDIIEQDGVVYILELSGRIGANGLPEIVSAHFGIDYYKMPILAALGLSIDEIWDNRKESKASMSKMIISSKKNGILKNLSINQDELNDSRIFEVSLFANPGFNVRSFKNSNDCLGQVITYGDDLTDCEEAMNHIFSKINLETDNDLNSRLKTQSIN